MLGGAGSIGRAVCGGAGIKGPGAVPGSRVKKGDVGETGPGERAEDAGRPNGASL